MKFSSLSFKIFIENLKTGKDCCGGGGWGGVVVVVVGWGWGTKNGSHAGHHAYLGIIR